MNTSLLAAWIIGLALVAVGAFPDEPSVAKPAGLEVAKDQAPQYKFGALSQTVSGDIVLHDGELREVYRIDRNGKVTIGKDVSLDDASEAFWGTVKHAGFYRCGELNKSKPTHESCVPQFIKWKKSSKE